MTLALYEDFADPLGRFTHYDTYATAQAVALAAQKHVDVRSFVQSPVEEGYSMFDLDSVNVQVLDGLSMQSLENLHILQVGEAWSAGTIGPQSDRNNFSGLSLACSAGTTVSASVMVTRPVDISAFANTDYLSLSCPAYPSGSITAASSFLDLTSDPAGDFTNAAATDSLAFSAATVNSIGSDRELRFNLSSLSHVARNNITGVRFRITTTAGATFRCLAIRVLAQSWEYPIMDQNTLYDRMGAAVPPTGSLTQGYNFPSGSIAPDPSLFPGPTVYATTDWPTLMFSDGATGPMPQDIDVGVIIHTGANLGVNTLQFVLREFPMIPNTMQDLESMTMADIAALSVQPDYTPAHINDINNTSMIKVTFTWGTNNHVEIGDRSSVAYSFALSLNTNTDYYAVTKLIDQTLRVLIYPIDQAGNIDTSTVVFDSLLIDDPLTLPRRQGRFGWYADFSDGDAYIRNIRPRRTVYQEYRSAPFVTRTPTVGARVFAETSPDTELFTEAIGTNGATVSFDNTKGTSGDTLKVQTTGIPLAGIITNPLRLANFHDCVISFSVYAPASAPLAALLYGEGRTIDLFFPELPANRWTPVTIPLHDLADTIEPGPYGIRIVQTNTQSATWYIDSLSVRTRAVCWQARQSNVFIDMPWTDLADTVNTPYDGALLDPGNALQVRGQLLRQDGWIERLKILPQYAQLGRLVWDDEGPDYGNVPVASFTTSIDGNTVTVDPTASTAANGLNLYHWFWGDGSESVSTDVTSHTYMASANYTISLTVIDQLNLQNFVTHAVGI